MSEIKAWQRRYRILAADDEPLVLELFRDIFLLEEPDAEDSRLRELSARLYGQEPAKSVQTQFELSTALQGEAALEAVQHALTENNPFAVAFLDVRMPPGKGGIWAAERIRKVDPDIQLIIITAYSDLDPAEIALRVPPADKLLYLQKPFHPQEIRQFAASLAAKWEAEKNFKLLNSRLYSLVEERTKDLELANQRLTAEIAERERVHGLIRAAVREWVATFDSVQDLVVILEKDLKVRRLNMALARRMGKHPRDLVGLPGAEIFDSPNEPGKVSQVIAKLADGGNHTLELGIEKLGGDFLVTISPFGPQTNGPNEIVLVAHDVTERKNLESRLRQAQKMEAIGTLAGGIAHDFNNMLGIIMGFAEMIADSAEPSGDLKRRVGHILEACNRGRDLVNQILTFSRQDGQELKPLRLGPLIKETLKLIRASLPKSIEFAEHLGAVKDTVLAEPSRLQQIILNLCANAAHAMRESGGKLTVLLDNQAPPGTSGQTMDFVRLSVADTGHGIAPQLLERVFEPFFTTKKPREGTGMGLAVVHGIVESLNGFVRVQSEPGQGACFDVYLPLCPLMAQTGAEPEPISEPGQGLVLWVDDEPSLLQMGLEMLSSLGYEGIGASGAASALEKIRLQGSKLSAVISDLAMPGENGLELAKQAAQLIPGLKIIILSGYTEELDQAGLDAAKVAMVLQKPLSRRDLAAALAKLTG